MLKINEVRIGNWINRDSEPSQIEDIDFISSLLELHNPIPLTEEWLVKFGFEYRKDLDKFIYKDGYWSLYKYNDIYYFDMGNIEVPINFLHQLQNLYFALTSKELVVNKS